MAESPLAFECVTDRVIRTNAGVPMAGNVVLGRVVHVHVRDTNTGQGTRDVELYRSAVEQIRAADPGYPRPVLALGFSLASAAAARVCARPCNWPSPVTRLR